MIIMENLLERIEKALQAVPYPAQPEGLYEPVDYVLSSGGKRVRPMLMLLAYGLYRDDLEAILPAAVGLETYHNHTLLHDDLMDSADMRHGRPTVHRRWDDNTAILSGDVMLIMAFRRVMQAGCAGRERLLDLFARTAEEVCRGQQYDVNFERRTDVSEAEYLEMIRLKTSVLLACAAAMGAIGAAAPDDDVRSLYRFAECLGLAFQIEDDYLDTYGDAAVFGKRIGGDILCGKKTFLLVSASARADEATRRELFACLADAEMADAEKIARVTSLYDRLGIAALCRERIEKYHAEARALLDALPVDAARKAPLRAFAESLLGRKS